MKPVQFLFAALAFGILFGCSTGKKALQKGDYDKAVIQAINRLKSNGGSKKARATLQDAYQYALGIHLDNVNRAKASSDPYKWEEVVNNYQSVNNLYEAIRRCPSCLEIVPTPAKYFKDLEYAQGQAAEARYAMGAIAMQQKMSREKAIEAHEHFKVVRNMDSQFKDVEQQLQEALYYATLKVVVEPIPRPMRAVDLRHEFFVNKINEYLHQTAINEYVRFFTPEEAQNQNLEFVDQAIQMEFDQFTLGNVFQNNTERQIVRDSVVVAQKDGEDVLGTVKATIRISEKSITGGGVLDFRVIDQNTRKILTQEKMPSEYVWTISWATFQGDERALNDEELAMTRRQELGVPSPHIMFEEFTAPLFDQVTGKIRNFYRRY
ncbi:MAG: hypothetical protein AAGC88_01340 [Bacteroidota bacterium]